MKLDFIGGEKPHSSCFFHSSPSGSVMESNVSEHPGQWLNWGGSRAHPNLDALFWLFKTFEICSRQKVKRHWQSLSLSLIAYLPSVALWTTLAVLSGSWVFVLTLVLLGSSLQVGFRLTPKSWDSVRGYKAQWFLDFIHSIREQFPGRLGPGSAQWIDKFMKTAHVSSIQWKDSERFWSVLSEVRNKALAQPVSKPLRESM